MLIIIFFLDNLISYNFYRNTFFCEKLQFFKLQRHKVVFFFF